MKNSPIPKSQTRSLKKQVRAGNSASQKTKSLQKKPFIPLYMMTNNGFPNQTQSQHALFDPQNKIVEKQQNLKHKRKNSKEKQKDSRRKITSAHHKKIKNFIGNKLQKRIESYFLFLALAKSILRSPVCKSFTDDRKYTVFVGRGNNSKLVKKLFYSRHWWNVTTDIKNQKINLIWTQWSKKSIFSGLQQQPQVDEQQTLTNKILCQQQPKKSLQFNQYNYILRGKQRDASKLTYVETELDVKAYLNSTKQSKKKRYITLTCNHIQGHERITDKKNLFFCLRQYCEENNQNCFNIIPLTFHIAKQEEFLDLEEVEKKLSEEDKRLLWIAKPGEKSNRGNGIKVFKKVSQIKQYTISEAVKHPNRTYIIQKYISPALFHRRKFDIRCFVVMIASPTISAYFFNDGYLRTCSRQFSLKDKKIQDKFMHLTNDAVQKKGTQYGKFEKGNKISFEEYQEFLDMFEKKEINFKRDILPRLKVLAAKSIAAGCSGFNQSNRAYSFQILGYDFMLDEDYKPWLIQVNTNPCLETGCPVLDTFIPSAVNNALKIAVDSVFRPPKVNDWHLQEVITFPEKILQPNKYQLIFQQVTQ